MLSRSDSFRKRGHHFDALESTSISDTEMLALNCLLTVAWWFNETDNEFIQYVICRNHIWFHLADLLFEVIFIIIVDLNLASCSTNQTKKGLLISLLRATGEDLISRNKCLPFVMM